MLFKGGNDLVSRAIRYFTGSPYVHAAVFLAGMTFESTVWLPEGKKVWMLWAYKSGIRETWGYFSADKTMELARLLIDEEYMAGRNYAVEQINDRHWYNFLLTFFDIIIYPTRWFWQKVGWIPFSSRYLGANCSEFVDQVYKAMGIDLWPDRGEASTVPGDYPSCPLLVAE
jgi:hypothetical protein